MPGKQKYLYPDTVVQIFTRTPEAGKCKTRLAKSVGQQAAAKIQSHMLDYLLKLVTDSHLCSLQICYHGTKDYFSRYLSVPLYQQAGSTLGIKMQNSMNASLKNFNKVLIIGSDCIGLTVTDLQLAINKLDTHDIVIAPATDGGYTLIGSKKPDLPVFKLDTWGEENVYTDTLQILSKHHYKWFALDPQIDIDSYADLVLATKTVPGWCNYNNNINSLERFTFA